MGVKKEKELSSSEDNGLLKVYDETISKILLVFIITGTIGFLGLHHSIKNPQPEVASFFLRIENH